MKTLLYILISLSFSMQSCSRFLDIEPPKTSLAQDVVYENNETATSALLGIYSGMAGMGYAGGGNTSITALAGLSANELENHNLTFQEFYDHNISPFNNTLSSLYAGHYQHIFSANGILEGLAKTKAVSPELKTQLEGEAYFIRGFVYFYLVNLFGDIPLQLVTDYRETRLTPLSKPERIYHQIIEDLKKAESRLTDAYPTTERVRPNLATVQALLARVYLFQNDWQNAEKYATLVINRTTVYKLLAPDNVFLKNSEEAIWQLFPAAGTNTREGNLFILNATPTNVSLNSSFATTGFEANDKRKTAWVRSYSNATGTWYYPFKYKVKSSSSITEYSMMMRLAEQFLIRAEAYAQQNRLAEALDDLDKIRGRAGLSLIKETNPTVSQIELLAAIQKERYTELFSEWGHRWFDLKRAGQAGIILSPLKPEWQVSDIYYPLPNDEVRRNPNID